MKKFNKYGANKKNVQTSDSDVMDIVDIIILDEIRKFIDLNGRKPTTLEVLKALASQ